MTRRALLSLLGAVALTAGTALPAIAAGTGRIVEVSVEGRQISVVFQADDLTEGVTVDTESVLLTVAGEQVEPEVQSLGAESVITRRTMLAVDNSRSMSGLKLEAAKDAARTFLDGLPDDVEVGLVTFGSTATVAVPPSADRTALRSALDALELDPVVGTALFDAAELAARQAGPDGVRSVLLLTDGNEDGSSTATLDEAVATASDSGVPVNAVYIGDDPQQPPELDELVAGTDGKVVTSDATDLAQVFESAAAAISSQLLVEAALPEGVGTSGNVVVSAVAGSDRLSDSAFATFASDDPGLSAGDYGPRPLEAAEGPVSLVSEQILPLFLGAVFLALLLLAYVATSSLRRDDKQTRMRRRLSIYTLTGRTPVKQAEVSTALGSSQVARSAVELAGKVVRQRGFEENLALRLEAASVPLRPAEWMLIHVGTAIGLALLGLLVSGGAIPLTVLGFLVGLGGPFAYLVIKESRRTSAFLAQLPDTLQLVAGSLSAGYSMPQALDTVVREGTQPMTGEFNRALVEARLGVPIEDALEGVAERMKSKDFAWVVMAIRIQREVGGNLAELLTTVSGTLRERERLRRQVKVLSAEGRLSAWILGLLPPVFALYLVLVRPEYLKPLVTETLGWLMLGLGVGLLAIGAFWMTKAVKVEV